MGINMNILYIYAHQEPASFNAALKTVAVETLEKAGHKVKVSDLYAMHFKPVLDACHHERLAGQGLCSRLCI